MCSTNIFQLQWIFSLWNQRCCTEVWNEETALAQTCVLPKEFPIHHKYNHSNSIKKILTNQRFNELFGFSTQMISRGMIDFHAIGCLSFLSVLLVYLFYNKIFWWWCKSILKYQLKSSTDLICQSTYMSFGLVSLFNGTSIFVSYLMPKSAL